MLIGYLKRFCSLIGSCALCWPNGVLTRLAKTLFSSERKTHPRTFSPFMYQTPAGREDTKKKKTAFHLSSRSETDVLTNDRKAVG